MAISDWWATGTVRFVDVDTRAVELMGERPWSRSLFANVSEALLVVGHAKVIGFDFVLSRINRSGLVDEKKAREGNLELRRVILEDLPDTGRACLGDLTIDEKLGQQVLAAAQGIIADQPSGN